MPIRTLTESVDRLEQEGHAVRDEVIKLRGEMERKNKRFAWTLGAVTVLVAIAIVVAFQVSLNNQRAIERSQQRWCPVVQPLAPRADDPPPVGTPEQQERALRIRAAFSHLVNDFGCQAQ